MSENNSPSVFTRLFALSGFAVVVSFAAIIAGVPINIPSRQSDTQPNGQIWHGDTAWVIVATTFVLALAPALAYMYGILHRSNLNDLMRDVTMVGALITFLWILFSFSLTYGKDAHNNGIMGYPATYYFFYHTQDQTAALNNAGNIPNSIFAVYELGFAVITAALVTISLAGRVNLNSFLIFIFIWHLIVYTPVAHVVWSPSGALNTNWVQDFSGALVVHILSSATSISLHLLLGKDEIAKAKPVVHSEQALTWTFVVFFLWFGFNAGKAHAPTANNSTGFITATSIATQSILNTIAATFTSTFLAYLYNTALDKPYTAVAISNAVLIGLVGITPASGYVTVGGAMVISCFTYLFTVIVANFVMGEATGVNESLSTVTIHSIAGTIGFIWTAILSYHSINPYGYNGLTAHRGIPLGYQLAGLVAVWTASFLATFILGWLVNLLAPLKQVQGFELPQKEVEGGNVEQAEQNKEV